MDYQTFIEQLPSLYHHWGQASVQPKSDRFQAVLQQIQGMTTANVLQLLNFAVDCMEPGEVYCEVGCFQGATLTGALLDQPDRMAYAIDNFSEFDVANENQPKLMQNLTTFGLEEQVFFCNQDFETFFADLRALETTDRIGVYLYDGAHDYRSQLLGLLLAKPFLADRALIIVDDSNWDAVQQANWDFIAAHPQCQLLLELPTPHDGYPTFWNGLQILSWDVHSTHHYDWSTLQNASKPALIQSIYRLAAAADPQPQDELQRMREQALALRESGQLADAVQLYTTILQQDEQAENWHGLGITSYLLTRYDEAFKALSQAIALDPAIAAYHYSMGLVLTSMGDIAAAAHAYQQAIALDATLTDAYNNLGNLILEHGDAHQAELHYRQAIALDPKHVGTYLNLGNALLAQNQIEAAIATYQIALQLDPNDEAVLENLAFATTLQHDPAQAALYLGNRFYRQQKYEAALEQFQAIVDTQAGDFAFYQALATCYKNVDQPEAAIAIYYQGLKHYPNEPSLYLSLMLELQNTGKLQAAIQVATEATDRFPNNIALKLEKQRLLPLIYQTPEEILVHRQRYSQALQALVEPTTLVTPEHYQTALTGIGQSTNFLLSYQGQDDLELQKQYGTFVQKVMAFNYPQWSKPLPLPTLKPGEKIRIGYVSGCLWSHTVGKLMLGWLRHHDRNAFEVYSYNVRDFYDQITQAYRANSDVFYQIPDQLEATCEQIVANQLHILVFFDLGMQGLMTQLAGLRLAPVQCSTWGHPVTSGLPTVDYFLSSDFMEPEKAQAHYSETLVRLPKIGIAYEQPLIPEPTKTRADFGLREDAVVYLNCQLLCKLLPQHDYLFAAIARQVPQAQFVFLARPAGAYVLDQFKQRLKRAFADYGLDSDQYCIMLPPQVQASYWDLNQRSDVFLDSLGWSGGHTTLEAIACNLPIVTCPGEFMRGRHSYAMLKALGMTDTIAQTETDYIDIAVRLGQQPDWRQQLVAQMRDRFSHLYNDTTCVTALEAFYRRAVGRGE